jgi:hypothetical protein
MALLHSIHLGPRTIWIALAGQTTNDERGILGGDTGLSHAGIVYSRAVCEFIARRERSKELCDKGCAAPPPCPPSWMPLLASGNN